MHDLIGGQNENNPWLSTIVTNLLTNFREENTDQHINVNNNDRQQMVHTVIQNILILPY